MSYRIKLDGTTKTVFDIGLDKFRLDASGFTGPHTWVLPDSNGSSGYALTTDGVGNLSWSSPSSAPAGADTQIQYNNSGVFGADASLTFELAYTDPISGSSGPSVGLGTNGGVHSTVFDPTFGQGALVRGRSFDISTGNYPDTLGYSGGYEIVSGAQGGSFQLGGALTDIGGSISFNGGGANTSTVGSQGGGCFFQAGQGDTGGTIALSAGSGNIGNGGDISLQTGGTSSGLRGNLIVSATSTANDLVIIGATGEWQLSGNAGTSGQVLTSSGTGSAPTWSTVAAAPGGSNTDIQFNDSGAFGGVSTFTWDKTNFILNLNGVTQTTHPQSTLALFEIKGRDGNNGSPQCDNITISGGNETVFAGQGATLEMNGGNGDNGGDLEFIAGNGGGSAGQGGNVNITGGNGAAGSLGGSEVIISGGFISGVNQGVFLNGNQVDLSGLTKGLTINGSAGSAGQLLTSQGSAAAPTWTNPKPYYAQGGSADTVGKITLVSGTKTVSTTAVLTGSRIFLTSAGGTITNLGIHYISAISSGTSFTITSVNSLDTSDVFWQIINP